jgi:drug/metabolite transporter (DMT)-like permease
MPYQLLALSAAFSWSIGGLIAAEPTRVLGGPRFTRIRMYWVSVLLALVAWIAGGWSSVEASDWLPLALSGFIGLAIGDAALFTAFARLGPRRTGILFAANAPMAAALSATFLGERFSVAALIGAGLVFLGVALAIALGTRPGQSHTWEEVRGSLLVGVGFGLIGALGQAVAIVIADPVFDGSLDPWAGAAVRSIVGTVGLVALAPWLERQRRNRGDHAKLTPRLLAVVFLSGTIGMAIGKTLVLASLTEGDAGIVSVLISTSPVLQLPLIWLITRERPAMGAWVGAALAVVGTALIV